LLIADYPRRAGMCNGYFQIKHFICCGESEIGADLFVALDKLMQAWRVPATVIDCGS
jgi:hypothetical protein